MTAFPRWMAAFLYVSGLRSNHWFAYPSVTDVFEAVRTNHGFLCPMHSLHCAFVRSSGSKLITMTTESLRNRAFSGFCPKRVIYEI